MDGMVSHRPGLNGKGSVFWFTARFGRIDLARLNKKPAASQTHALAKVMRKMREIALHKHIVLVEHSLVNNTVMLKLLQTLGLSPLM
ncbi:uncharacterized protein N7473_006074 [Penicillium subrubescens]|uniref:uncharacterized protein n=1 Tax=Penicillium subrubescens TaxID=1316194 RepID=UPI0025453461|nr:uncharacterized protein N7473_006074 [Penicillium subrubescens]KAJ5896675.1 hypothetical protein N7473_006074 [Penicillium subrubescens]